MTSSVLLRIDIGEVQSTVAKREVKGQRVHVEARSVHYGGDFSPGPGSCPASRIQGEFAKGARVL
jgi:hypothetical protein